MLPTLPSLSTSSFVPSLPCRNRPSQPHLSFFRCYEFASTRYGLLGEGKSSEHLHPFIVHHIPPILHCLLRIIWGNHPEFRLFLVLLSTLFSSPWFGVSRVCLISTQKRPKEEMQCATAPGLMLVGRKRCKIQDTSTVKGKGKGTGKAFNIFSTKAPSCSWKRPPSALFASPFLILFASSHWKRNHLRRRSQTSHKMKAYDETKESKEAD